MINNLISRETISRCSRAELNPLTSTLNLSKSLFTKCNKNIYMWKADTQRNLKTWCKLRCGGVLRKKNSLESDSTSAQLWEL